jgi:hypothetical protein
MRVVVPLDARRGIRGDDGKAGDGTAAIAFPNVMDVSEGGRLELRLEAIWPLLLAFLVELLLLVLPARRHQATSLLEGLPVMPDWHPMSAFDSCKPSLVHDQLNDRTIDWQPELYLQHSGNTPRSTSTRRRA